MKKVLLLTAAVLVATTSFAQGKAKAETMTFSKKVTSNMHVAAPAKHSLSKEFSTVNSRRGQKEGFFYARPEGTYWIGNSEVKYLVVPPFTDLTFINASTNATTGTWALGTNDATKYVDADNNLTYNYSKPSYGYVSYVPTLKEGENTFEIADAVMTTDSVPQSMFPFNYSNCTRYYGFTGGGSAFMSGEDSFDFDGDKNPEPFYSQFRQYFEKPASPLNLHEVILWATTADPNFDGSKLKMVLNKVVYKEKNGKKYRTIGEQICEMSCTADMSTEVLDKDKAPVYPGDLTFANVQQDEFGTEEAVPVLIDDEFAITIVGTEDPTVDVRFYFCDQGEYPEEWYTWATPTYILPVDANGNSMITDDMNPNGLSYFGNSNGTTYCYNMAFIFYGEMDGIKVTTEESLNQQVAPVAGGTTESPATEGQGEPAYVWTNYPFFEEDGESYTDAGIYSFEGMPEWATASIDPTYYEYGRDTNQQIRGLHMIWFNVEPLPEGVTGRLATVNIVSTKGGKANAPLYILQGDAKAPTGVNTIKFDANGKLTGKTFNLNGQNVNSDTKGIVIRDGKKYFNK